MRKLFVFRKVKASRKENEEVFFLLLHNVLTFILIIFNIGCLRDLSWFNNLLKRQYLGF